MDTFDDWLDVEPDIAHDAADIDAREPLVTIVAEVGTIDVPLSALAGLAVGDVLTGDASAGELVALKVAGRVIARATLLDIDGKLAARIEQI
jgi:type III secretion protein Q